MQCNIIHIFFSQMQPCNMSDLLPYALQMGADNKNTCSSLLLMFVAIDFRYQLNGDEPLIVNGLAPFPYVLRQVPLLLIFIAAGAFDARLLRRRHEHTIDDIEGEKATPIDYDCKPFLMHYCDDLKDFGAAFMEQLHWVFDEGTVAY